MIRLKINRLLEITILLLNKGTITAKELAERFEVSRRTIYRDIDVLSSAGVPVYTNKGNGGGISLLESYALKKTLISEKESESLLLGLKTLQAAKFPEIEAVLDKIGSVFKNSDSVDWVDIDFSHWGSSPNENNKFLDIKKAILGRNIITFDYINSFGGRSYRYVEPMKLLYKGQAWYIWGFCKAKEDFRTFRISRIKNVTVTSENFGRRKLDEVGQYKNDENHLKPVNLKLKFCQQVMYRVYDSFDEELITKNLDGTCNVSVTFPEDEWVYGFIMSFGCYVEVLEPQNIREIIADSLRKTLEFYEK